MNRCIGRKQWRRFLAATAVFGIALCGYLGSRESVATSRLFLCFFDLGSTELSGRCRDVMTAFVADWSEMRDGKKLRFVGEFLPAYSAHVVVVGHAQASEDVRENDDLSERRARAVADMLERAGIPRDLMTIVGSGSRQPLVPGEVPDPQNRRVAVWPR